MISFHNLQQYKKILLLFLLILCVSCLLAPLIKIAVDLVVSQSALMADLLKYKHGSYDFGKVMRRIILGVAILVIFLFRKPLMINSLSTIGIKHTTGWWEHLQMGFFLSTGIFILYTSFLFITGTKILQVDAKSLGDLFFQLFKFLLIAGLVGCIEEIFFRGFIFRDDEDTVGPTQKVRALGQAVFTDTARQSLNVIGFVVEKKNFDRKSPGGKFPEREPERCNTILEIRYQAAALGFAGIGEQQKVFRGDLEPFDVLREHRGLDEQ